jgi:hypothetical protein
MVLNDPKWSLNPLSHEEKGALFSSREEYYNSSFVQNHWFIVIINKSNLTSTLLYYYLQIPSENSCLYRMNPYEMHPLSTPHQIPLPELCA